MKRRLLVPAGIVLLALLIAGLLIRSRRIPQPAGPEPREASTSATSDLEPGARPATLYGVVTRSSTREPIPHAILEILTPSRLERRIQTDVRGRFAVGDLRPRDYTWRAKVCLAGKYHELGAVILKGGEVLRRDVELAVGPALRGRVRTWDQQPLADAALEVQRLEAPSGVFRYPLRLEEGGRFTVLVDEPQGSCKLSVHHPRYLPSEALGFRMTDKDAEDFDFLLRQGGSVGGVVNDDLQALIRGARVSLAAADDPDDAVRIVEKPLEASTDAEGRFDFAAVPDGVYTLVVQAKGYGIEHIRPVAIETGRRTPDLRITLRKGWAISGRAVAASGRAIEGAKLEIREGGASYRTRTLRNGEFKVEGIKPDAAAAPKFKGIDLLRCTHKGHAPGVLSNLEPGTSVTVVLGEPGALEVRIALAEGEAEADFPWTLLTRLTEAVPAADDLDERTSIRKLKGPVAVVEDLAPGYYDLDIGALGRESVRRQRILVTPGGTAAVQAVLAPGTPSTAVALKISKKDLMAGKGREQLLMLIRTCPPQLREQLIEQLRSMRDLAKDVPEAQELLDEALKAPRDK